MPKRIQRKRTKGWKMPDGAVYVVRPTKWGNPFTPDDYWDAGFSGTIRNAIAWCIRQYIEWLDESEADLTSLRGKDLTCWCPLDQPCHADVLLELANANSLRAQEGR